jgi:hypothetical protein
MRIYRYVGSFLLGAALIAPAGMLAGTNFQDDHHQDDKHRDRDDKNQRRTTTRTTRTTTTGMTAKPVITSDGPLKITVTTVTSRISSARSSQNTGIGATTIRMMTGAGTNSTRLLGMSIQNFDWRRSW